MNSHPIICTSDTHFGHANILTYCPGRQRWAADIEAMDRELIASWNAMVKPGAVVLHCGDFAMGPKDDIARYRAQLNGVIWLVLGNHDRSASFMKAAGFEVVAKRMEFSHPTLGAVIARHNPQDFTQEDAEAADWLLHGHCHGERPDPDSLAAGVPAKAFDIGVDARPPFVSFNAFGPWVLTK